MSRVSLESTRSIHDGAPKTRRTSSTKAELSDDRIQNQDVTFVLYMGEWNGNTHATNLRGLRITMNLNMLLSGSMLAQAKRSSPPFGDNSTTERPITENLPAKRKRMKSL